MRPDGGHAHDRDEKAYDVNEPSDSRSGDEIDSRRSSEDAQAGVKRIEAVSKAWTLVSLTIAYVRYVLPICCCSDPQSDIFQSYGHCQCHILGNSGNLQFDFLRDKRLRGTLFVGDNPSRSRSCEW